LAKIDKREKGLIQPFHKKQMEILQEKLNYDKAERCWNLLTTI